MFDFFQELICYLFLYIEIELNDESQKLRNIFFLYF